MGGAEKKLEIVRMLKVLWKDRFYEMILHQNLIQEDHRYECLDYWFAGRTASWIVGWLVWVYTTPICVPWPNSELQTIIVAVKHDQSTLFFSSDRSSYSDSRLYISAAAAATFSDFYSVNQCNWCRSKSHDSINAIDITRKCWMSIGPLFHWSFGWMSNIKIQ